MLNIHVAQLYSQYMYIHAIISRSIYNNTDPDETYRHKVL